MPNFIGCKEAKEISLTRTPQNTLAVALLTKSKPANPAPENHEMTAEEITKAATAAAVAAVTKSLAMSDVAKAHLVTLDEAGQTAFLEKSTADQTAEAEAAKAAKDAAAEAEAAKAAGATATEAALTKSVTDLTALVGDLRKTITDDRQTAALEKRARSDFAGFPGGEAAAVEVLKSVVGLPEAVQKSVESGMLAQISAAKAARSVFGFTPSEEEIAKAAPATARIEKAAKERAAAKSIPYEEAFTQVIELREFADDVAAMSGEAAAV